MKINEKIILFLLFTVLVGLCSGAFFEVFMSGAEKDQLEALLDGFLSTSDEKSLSAGAGLFTILISSLAENLIIAMIIITASYIIITLPLIPLLIIIKAIASGFSAAMTIEILGMQGLLHLALYMFPPNIIRIAALCIMGGISIKAGIMRCTYLIPPFNHDLRRKRKALQSDAKRLFLYYLIGLAAVIISCLMEAFLLQSRL